MTTVHFSKLCFLLLFIDSIITAVVTSDQKRSLDGYVSSYQIIKQSLLHLSTIKSQSYHHRINVFNRSFVLVLNNDDPVNYIVEMDNREMSMRHDFLVRGYVLDHEHASWIVGSVINSRFQGEIAIDGDDSYFVENAETFGIRPVEDFSSVVYRGSDIAKQLANKTAVFDKLPAEWLRAPVGSVRAKREARSISNKTTGKVCGVFMQVDHLLFQEYVKTEKSSEVAVKAIMGLVHYLIHTANSVFSSTKFGSVNGMQISIIRTKIFKTQDEFEKRFGKSLSTSLDSVSFLRMISTANYDHVCAAYMLTYRYFDGVLGLAWMFTSDPMTIIGGVCAKQTFVTGYMRKRSQNSGIVTMANYGKRISFAMAASTFIHELGHNFGADHDPSDDDEETTDKKPTTTDRQQCQASDENSGNFVMFPKATSGIKKNNFRFSTCSQTQIATTLQVLKTHPDATDCLKDVAYFCGNSIVDPDEECDCGFSEDCADDANCCGPADDPNPAARCRLRRRQVDSRLTKVECSASNGICCNVTTCSFTPKSERFLCHHAEECKSSSLCNGSSAVCPAGEPEPDGKICGGLAKICLSGECLGSSCELINNFTSCQTKRPHGHSRYNRSELCYMSCRSQITGDCYNSANVDSPEFNEDFRSFLQSISNGQPVQLAAGSPCDDDRGYCDVLRRCRPINSQGPLARLTGLLTSHETITTLRSWIEQRWYLVAFIGVAIVILSVGFIKLCAVHTSSDNRSLAPAQSLGDTLYNVRRFRQRRNRSNREAVSTSANRNLTELQEFLTERSETDRQTPQLTSFHLEESRKHSRRSLIQGRTRIIQSDYIAPARTSRQRSRDATSTYDVPSTIDETTTVMGNDN